MEETLKTFLVGVGGTGVGIVLGAANQWFFTRRAEGREVQRLLINLYGEAEGKCLVILNAAKDMTAAHWTLVHRRWQDKHNLVELPEGNNIRPEHNEMILVGKMREAAEIFKIEVAQLRTFVSQFSAIVKDNQIMEKYFSIQNFDPLIYDSVVEMTEEKYRQNLFIRLPEVINAVNNNFGKVADELFLLMKSFIIGPKKDADYTQS